MASVSLWLEGLLVQDSHIGPDKDIFAPKCNYFLTHEFKRVFRALKRTVSF